MKTIDRRTELTQMINASVFGTHGIHWTKHILSMYYAMRLYLRRN